MDAPQSAKSYSLTLWKVFTFQFVTTGGDRDDGNAKGSHINNMVSQGCFHIGQPLLHSARTTMEASQAAFTRWPYLESKNLTYLGAFKTGTRLKRLHKRQAFQSSFWPFLCLCIVLRYELFHDISYNPANPVPSHFNHHCRSTQR